MGDKYKDHIFSKEEIQDIIRGFFEQNRELRIGNEEKKQMTQIIEDILYAYNEYAKSLMSSGERTLHNTLSSDFSKIMDKLGMIEEQPRKENIKKFLRAIEISKEIELENIEELINGEYEIDRSEIIETIQAGREKLVSIQGNAGSGKSVVCKKLLKGKEYVLVTRAENLSTGKKVNELWDCDVEDAILWLENKPLYIFIDAIEFIADCGDNAFPLLQEIYRLADKYSNVYIITSCRTTDSSAFMKINTKYRIKTYEIPDLAKDEIDKVAKSYPIILSLQQNKKYSDLLCVPFYLNLIVSGGFVEENINDENNFRNLIWERIICLKDKCRKYGVSQSDVRNNVERIVFERARSFVVGVDSDIVDSDILEALKSEGIIVESKNKIRLKYDIFEDICFERYIDKAFDACHGSYNNFFDEIEKIGRCIYRRYQIWISNKLFVQEAREKFVYTLLTDNSIEANWKKQTEIGIVKSKYCGMFFKEFQELLGETVIEELLDITNLYAFEAKINHSPALIMNVKQNWLRFTKRRPTEKDGGVLSLLASVKGCLTYFQNGARNLSFNYKHHKDEDKRPGDDDYTFENAIESVLTEFHLSREQIRYLKPIVMGGQVKSKKDKKDSNGKMSLKYFDRSVYDRGFRYYDFIDDPNHSMRSEIQLFDFQDSPERILLHLSEKAQIIGISATATLDTVIGNYDLEYLQRMLQDKFYVMPEVDKCRLQESFRTFVANYDKVNIHVEPVCYSTDDTAELAEIFNGNEALIKKYAEKLSISFERVEYAKNNFIRVVKVMKAFGPIT